MDESTEQMAYVKGNEATDPAMEAVRQVFSGISLVCDRLDMVPLEHAYTPEQTALMGAAFTHLREAHRLLKQAVR